nr:hypothetical protein REQ54_01767 [Rhizobium sp. Q54]
MEAKNRAKPTDEQVAAAMRALEDQISELTYMAHITADLTDSALAAADTTDGDMMLYRISRRDIGVLIFSINEIERRIDTLHETYLSALERGETVQ